ncbi:hypothetical protein [Burkholderia vietnamiensis]|uniref:Secreted protein n=2 Tax=Burkholderia vietnamiensis TaxID=60552 RepID=A0AAW7TCP6_BURVI|nr:hypothetical protein [Burkholderia vietnamiensis]MBH9645738.1 hypothetical protein [Burkholderia vietnamiensis]MBR8008255.1 hypothetical protein [Burkholderia vietnamiensis]MDN7798498.1 hypothetical protein [Burkholderia vietnamiensis]HDR8983213.1 hypothetical protein [Burkholderia vietnamiensis]HDR9001049.1 hypothetical protein [Burkholderia vietnamiensis]
MNGMTNLVMLLIAMHGGSAPPAPALRYAVASQAVNRRPPMKTDAVICKDGQVHTFLAGQPKPCI